jgi:hypothetical protein
MDFIDRQSARLLGPVMSPDERPLSTQDSSDTDKKRTDINVSSGIRTHDLSVSTGEEFHVLDRAATVIGK